MSQFREGRVIRDFIYVDVDRLYSLYSQIFEGVADQIVQSYMDASSSTDSSSNRESRSREVSIEAKVAEMSRRTENKFLYDHMYNRFEAAVADTIIEAGHLTESNYRDGLIDSFLVKITGSAEVEDYTRLNAVMEKFNTIGEAIAYASVANNQALNQAVEELQNTAENLKDRNARAKAKNTIGRQTDKNKLAKKFAEETGLHQDEQTFKNLRLFSEMFYPDGFDITIVPIRDGDSVAFRGVLDKRWLRTRPDLLRALYGGYVESEWTMVGQVTYLPGVALPTSEEVQTDSTDESNPSMRDPFRNMFRSARVMERMFLESKHRPEVVICPIAIYRETRTISPSTGAQAIQEVPREALAGFETLSSDDS
jgi:hypothetical protein